MAFAICSVKAVSLKIHFMIIDDKLEQKLLYEERVRTELQHDIW